MIIKYLKVIFSLGLIAVISTNSQASTMAICTGFGPGPTGNEFKNEACDYTEINDALGTLFTSNADIDFVAKGNVGETPDGLTVLETHDQGTFGTIKFETEKTAQIVVEKFGTIYQAYLFSDMVSLGNNQYSFMRDVSALNEDACSAKGVNCKANTSHVSTYVPIPAAAWLFGTALFGLISIGYRRTQQLPAQ